MTVLALAGCAQRAPPQKPLRTSGFLDDYGILRESGPGDVRHVYRNPDARWASIPKVLLEPVTIWRGGRKSLEPVPKEDLLRLVEDFQGAVRARLATPRSTRCSPRASRVAVLAHHRSVPGPR